MITVDHYEFVRVANRVYEKGIREIAREFGHHRVAVRKAIAGMKPEYWMKKARKSPVMDAVREVVVGPTDGGKAVGLKTSVKGGVDGLRWGP